MTSMSSDTRHALSGARVLWAGAIGFWLFVAALSLVQIAWLARSPGQQVDVRRALTWQAAYFLPWIPFTIGIWSLTSGWLPERFGGWGCVVGAHVPVAAAVGLAHSLVVALFGPMPPAAPPGASATFAGRFAAQLRGELIADALIYTAVAATGAAMTLYRRYQDREIAAARLEAELATARLSALRAHLQPHFLFNSLHSVAALARAGDMDGVVRMIAALSDLLRQVLDAGDRHATLREEMNVVERYLEIQRARFADRLGVTIDLALDAAEARVPFLLVHTLVENAVRHGLAPRVREGSLTVKAARDDGRTRIEVEDNGVGVPPGWTLEHAGGTGLRNLASRLAGEFGKEATLEVTAREGGGVRATVTLPYAAS